MKRFVLMVAAGALFVAACTGSGDDAARADGTESGTVETTEVTETTVAETTETTVAETTETTENPLGSIAATVGGQVISVASVERLAFDPEAELSPGAFADYLGAAVQWAVIEQSASKAFAIAPTDEEIEEGITQLIEDFADGAAPEEFLEARSISEEVLRQSAVQLLIQNTVREEVSGTIDEPSEAEAQQAIDAAPTQWTTVCVSHILVATEDEATAVIARVGGGGEDFGAVAEEVSIDTGSGLNGGDLGCTTPSDYVPQFADETLSADIGEISEPVQTQFGFHVIRVDSREDPTVEGVKELLLESLVDTAVSDWYLEMLGAAEVNVVAEYGTWVTNPTPHVEPPS